MELTQIEKLILLSDTPLWNKPDTNMNLVTPEKWLEFLGFNSESNKDTFFKKINNNAYIKVIRSSTPDGYCFWQASIEDSSGSEIGTTDWEENVYDALFQFLSSDIYKYVQEEG
jgi:hypothetical protein